MLLCTIYHTIQKKQQPTLSYVSILLQKPFPLPPSQSEATQVYMVDFPADAHPPQTLVAMVTSFNSLNNAIQALLVHAETLANEVCEFCDFADIVGSRTTVIQSSVMFFREFPCNADFKVFTCEISSCYTQALEQNMYPDEWAEP